MEGNIKRLKNKEGEVFYPLTHCSAIYFDDGVTLETKEQTRDDNETTREANEDIRVSNENIRESNETIREDDETTRNTAEATRTQNEDQRLTNETTRQSQESTRVSNENTRISTENTRVSAENTRISNETQRQTDYATVISEYNTATLENTDVGVIALRNEIENASDTPELSNTASIFSIGKGKDVNGVEVDYSGSVVNGQVSAIVKGRSLKNELNYNKDTWTEWTKSGASGDSTGMEFTTINGSYVSATLLTQFKPNTKYGYLFNVVSNNLPNPGIKIDSFNAPQSADFHIGASVGNLKLVNTTRVSIANNWFKFATINTLTTGLKVKIKDIRVFELPAGSEIESDFNTLTADQLAQKYPYIKGGSTKSTVNGTVKSVSKNKFNGKWENKYINANDGTIVEHNEFGLSEHIAVLPNQQYTAWVEGASEVTIIQFGEDNTSPKTHTINSSGNIVTSPLILSNVKTIRIKAKKVGGFQLTSKGQLEEGGVATEYEPHQESELTYTLPEGETLKSISSGESSINDEIRDSGEKIKRVSDDTILNGSNAWNSYVENTTDDWVRMKIDNWQSDNNSAVFNNNNQVAKAENNDYHFNIGIYSTDKPSLGVSNGNLYIYLSRSETGIIDLTTFLSYLNDNPITLIYQLANPIVTQVETEGTLQSYEKGTIYYEPYIAKMFDYQDGITFTHPVSQVDKIKGFLSGEWVELANDYTLATDGLSLTIDGIVNGQEVKVYAPIISEESTLGTVVHTAPTSIQASVRDLHVNQNAHRIMLDEHDDMLLGLALENIDQQVEITNARGGEVDLDTRLDGFDSQLADITQKVDFVDFIKDRARAYNRMRFRKVADNNYNIILDDGNEHISYQLIKDPDDDFIKLGEGFIGILNYVQIDLDYASERTGTWTTSNVNYYTTQIDATFTCSVKGGQIDFTHFADDRGGVFEFVIDGDTANPITISTFSATGIAKKKDIIKSGLDENATHTVVGTFKGDDPENTPSTGVGTARGWVYSDVADVVTGSVNGYAIGNQNDYSLIDSLSNKEMAYLINNTDWIPEHNGVAVVSNINEPEFLLDGVSIDIATLDTSTFLSCNEMKLVQHFYGNPTGFTGNVIEFIVTHKINMNGVCEISGQLKVLQDLQITGYPAMLPLNPTLNEFVIDTFESHVCSNDETYHYFTSGSDKVMSGIGVSSVNQDYAASIAVKYPIKTLRLGKAGKTDVGKEVFVWDRTTDPKLYFQPFKNHNANANEFYAWNVNLTIAHINNIYNLIKS